MVLRLRSSLLALFLFLACFAVSAQDQSGAARFQEIWQRAKSVSPQETIGTSKELSQAERAGLVKALVSELRGPKSRPAQTTELELKDEATQSRVQVITLGVHQGEKFFVVEGSGEQDCSPTGNCGIWIFRHGPQGYSAILYGIGQMVLILPTSTNGFKDVVLRMHGSAFSGTLKVYKFKSVSYRRSACYEENFRVPGPDGEYHDVDEGQIAPCTQ